MRLALEGHRAALAEREDRRARRLRALHAHRAEFTGSYGEGYLDQLRSEWPA